MKRVLLTGASGFVAQHCIAPLLASGYEVHATSTNIHHNKAVNLHWHQVDLLDTQQTQSLMAKVQPSHLLHFAWFVAHGQYWTSLENIRWVQASLDLVQAFSRYGGTRVVMAGTCAEYDWTYGYCSESLTPCLPATMYGTCKHSLQNIVTSVSRHTKLSAAWGRIFFLYGPHEHPKRLIASVIRSLLQSEPAAYSHGNQIRDFLFVQDVADAFVALLNSKVQGSVNVASGQARTLRSIVTRIGEMLDRSSLVQFGALPTSIDEPPLLVANIKRLTDEVGWQPRYDMDQGLEQTIDWWKTRTR